MKYWKQIAVYARPKHKPGTVTKLVWIRTETFKDRYRGTVFFQADHQQVVIWWKLSASKNLSRTVACRWQSLKPISSPLRLAILQLSPFLTLSESLFHICIHFAVLAAREQAALLEHCSSPAAWHGFLSLPPHVSSDKDCSKVSSRGFALVLRVCRERGPGTGFLVGQKVSVGSFTKGWDEQNSNTALNCSVLSRTPGNCAQQGQKSTWCQKTWSREGRDSLIDKLSSVVCQQVTCRTARCSGLLLIWRGRYLQCKQLPKVARQLFLYESLNH